MSQRIAILCSGQGAQNRAMYDLVKDVPYQQWLKEAGVDTPLNMILENPNQMFLNKYAQPLIVSCALAFWEKLKQQIDLPIVVAGYSIGEIAAYGVAGSLSSSEAVKVSVERAKLMDECRERNPSQSLMAVFSKSWDLSKYHLYLAIDNRPYNIIVGGLIKDLEVLSRECLARNIKTVMIPVEIASHTPLMKDAVEPFKKYLENSSFKGPVSPVLAGLNSRIVKERDLAIHYLARALAEPLEWGDCMDICVEQRIDVALEIGPGRALTRILKERHPEIRCRAVDDFRSIDGIVSWVKGHEF